MAKCLTEHSKTWQPWHLVADEFLNGYLLDWYFTPGSRSVFKATIWKACAQTPLAVNS